MEWIGRACAVLGLLWKLLSRDPRRPKRVRSSGEWGLGPLKGKWRRDEEYWPPEGGPRPPAE